jgi:hypothetical protein
VGASKNIQNVRQVDATNSDNRQAIDSSGRSAIQNPPNLDAAISTLATEAKLEAVRVLLNSLDGKDFATQTTLATLATDTVLQEVRDRIGAISATPAANTLQDRLKELEATLTSIDGKDFATQTTLALVLTKLTEIDTVLDAIKDTDGIKKIADALPVGDNWIGKTKVGDGTDTVAVITDDDGAKRLATATKLRDSEGREVLLITRGAQDFLYASDHRVPPLLKEIKHELQKLNMHMSLVNDTDVKPTKGEKEK